MRVLSAAFAALLVMGGCSPQASSGPIIPAHQHGADTALNCADTATPLGALPPAVPAWCVALTAGVDSAVRGVNSWTDEFRSGAVNARLSTSYRVFELGRPHTSTVFRTQHFAQNGHWMVDVAGRGAPLGVYAGAVDDFAIGPNNGGALMRPDAEFGFEDGRLVVEVDVAAGMNSYGDHAWPEIVVTTANAPIAEGGAPTTPARGAAWRTCTPSQADELCRDRFRVVLEKDAVALSVNGVRYMEHRGLPEASRLPGELLRSSVYVYFASWTYLGDPAVVRFHWGRIAINP